MKGHGSIVVAGVLSIGVVGLHLWSLLRYPAPFVDEAWYASRAWGLIATGKPFGVLDAGVFDRFPGYGSYFQWLPAAIQSIALRLDGRLELLPLRLISLGFGILLSGAVGLIGLQLGGVRLAFVSALLVALSQPFFYSAHLARYDVMVAALGFLSLGLMIANVRRRMWMAALAGLILAISFEIHPNAMIFGPVIVAVGLTQWGWSFLGGRDLWTFVGATLFGLLGYAVIHILPSPNTYFTLYRLIYGPTDLPPILTRSLSLVLVGLGDELGLLLATCFLGIGVGVLAAIVFAGSRKRNERVLSVLGLALFLSQALLIRNKFEYYAILVTPGLDLLLAAFLLRFVEAGHTGQLAPRVAAVLTVLAILVSSGVALLPLQWDGYQNYVQVQDRIDGDVHPADVIMASQTYWFGLYQHKYYSWEQLVYFQRASPGCGLRDAMAHFRPDIFIVDGHLQGFITDPGQSSSFYSGLLALLRPDLNGILAEHATLVDRFDGGGYGQVGIYRLSWPDSSQPGSQGSSTCQG